MDGKWVNANGTRVWTCVTISNTEASCHNGTGSQQTFSWDGTKVTSVNYPWEGTFAGDDLINWRQTTTGETTTWTQQGKLNTFFAVLLFKIGIRTLILNISNCIIVIIYFQLTVVTMVLQPLIVLTVQTHVKQRMQ